MRFSELFLFLSSIVCFVRSDDDGYICNATLSFDPPQDLTQSVYYPTGWTEQQPAAKFAPNQRCIWKVNIPQGLYAQVAFYKNTDPAYDIYVEYLNSKVEKISNDDHMPYNFVAPYASFVMYQSNMKGAFSFKITWSKYPEAAKKTSYIQSGAAPVAFSPNDYYLTLQADNRVALAGFNTKDPNDMALLRQTAVYAGDSTDGEFIGTLSQVFHSSNQVVTVNDKLTIFTFDLYKHIGYTMFMAQDSSDCTQFGRIQGYNCPDTGDCKIEISSVYSPSLVVTVADTSDFVKGFDFFDETSTFKIFEGVVSDDHLIASVSKANYRNQLPIRVNNNMKFYTMDKVRTQVTITKDSNNANWNRLSDGRQGIIHSYDYGYSSYKQDTEESFTSYGEQLFFKLSVKDADLTPNQSDLTVLIMSNGNIVYGNKFNKMNPPPTVPIEHQGDLFKVTYQTAKEASNGFRIDFAVSSQEVTTVSPSSSTRTTQKVTPVVTTPSSTALTSTALTSKTPHTSKTSSFQSSTKMTPRPTRLVSQPTVPHLETTTSGSFSHFTVFSVIGYFLIYV